MTEQGTVRGAIADAASVLLGAYVAQLGLSLLVGGVPFRLDHLLALPLSVLQGFWSGWLIFAGLLALVALALPAATGGRATRGVRLWLAVPSAAIAWVAGSVIRALLVHGDPLVFLLFGIPAFVSFVAGAAAAVLVVSRLRRGTARLDGVPAEPRRRRRAVEIVGGVALGLAVLLVGSFPVQWFSAYFAIWGPRPEASPEEATVYLVTFLVAVALAVLALVLAAVGRRRRAVAGSLVVLVLALAVGFVCQIPAGSVWLEPGPPAERPAPGEPGGGVREECAWDASRPGCGG